MAKDTFCLLAQNYDKKISITGWWMSEKLDGMRAIWIPESRGKYIEEIPWANREKDSRRHLCTGLWSRLRKPIFAPSWWLDQLPNTISLDGELWAGHGRFQEVMSICKTLEPGDKWKDIKYKIIDAPRLLPGFEYNMNKMMAMGIENEVVSLIQQRRLSSSTPIAIEEFETELERVTFDGGEGLMLRKPGSVWNPSRDWCLLKAKKWDEGVGIVKGYTFGRETDRGSRLIGKMGALILALPSGNVLEISGFTDQEREFGDVGICELGMAMPGKQAPNWVNHPLFPLGSMVRFRFKDLTNDGIPKVARYWR